MGPWLGLAARSVLNMHGWIRLDLKIWRTVLSAFAGARGEFRRSQYKFALHGMFISSGNPH
jgi:hypothetical protein